MATTEMRHSDLIVVWSNNVTAWTHRRNDRATNFNAARLDNRL